MRRVLYLFFISFLFTAISVVESCSKSGGSGSNPPPNPCAGITIVVGGTTTDASVHGGSDGSISASASGSTNFTFSLNGGPFQSSGTFNNLKKGNYTVEARDGNTCSGSKQFNINEPTVCGGVTITITSTTTSSLPCSTTGTGSITITASGSSGFIYSVDSGAFQQSNIFNSVNAGIHSVSAKDSKGCLATVNVTVSSTAPGPQFAAVKAMMANNCVGCHNASQAEGGMNWTVDCNIVANKDRIRARAVDANPSPMPPTGLLPAADRQKILDWINGGGQFEN